MVPYPYVEQWACKMLINCHSYYSLRYGTITVKSLVQQGLAAGMQAMAITDINTSTGVFDFIQECRKYNIKPVVGMEFRRGQELRYIALAKNNEGFREINQWRSQHNIHKTILPDEAPAFNDCFLIYPLGKAPSRLKEHEYVGVRIQELNKLYRHPLLKQEHKLVILHPITFSSPDEYRLHKLLRGVDNNTLLSKLTNKDYCQPNEYMIAIDDLLGYYEQYPYMAANTYRLLDQCDFEFDFKKPKNKQTYTNSKYSDKLLLESLAKEGMVKRYGHKNKEAERRVLRELEIIDQMNFSAYFLITWDIIRYSMSRGFYHVGRGSGANSIVSYVLHITDICPIELNLYFERFLNPSRTSPPDFDIDWSWKDRDEILNYIFNRFDTQHTAFTGTIASFKHRSTMRELGKVLGLPKEELDELSSTAPEQHPDNHIVRAIHKYGKMLVKYPNQRSMHACGVYISEKPLYYYSSLDMPPKGFRTVQFDMYIGEEIGFEKLDVLSQRGIGHINDCIKLIKSNRSVEVDIHDLNEVKDNPRCNKLLGAGKTLGCFYIESPAMRGLLRRLKCDSYKVLVAASSVIRPGVAKSGMMREYISRHNNPNDFEYFHPVFEEQLGETYGIMVYQEDVIKIAHHFAGLDLADADVLRRAMSGKTRSRKEFDAVRDRFFQNCKKIGYSDELSKEVYRQIESFAGYSFCKAHSASYSVESYQSLYLKAFYPLEFMVAVINNFGGFYRTEVYFHELKMEGANIHQPCVNNSQYMTSIQGKEVYVGFIHVEKLDKKTAELIPQERAENGPYTSLENLIRRIPIGIETVQLLIYVGAFRFTKLNKGELALEAHMLLGKQVVTEPTLFYASPKKYKLPTLSRDIFEDVFDELELLGFFISRTPFDLLETRFRGDVMARDLTKYNGKSVRMLGYLICRKQVPTVKGLMNFGTWIDFNGDLFDSTHFPLCLKQYPFKGSGCYLLKGTVSVDFDFPSVEIEKMAKLPMIPDPRYSDEQVRRIMNMPTSHDNNPGIPQRAPYPKKGSVKF